MISIRSNAVSNWAAQAETSCPRVRGTASWRWVRPIFMISFHSLLFWWNTSMSFFNSGINVSFKVTIVAIWIAAGKTSFVDWEQLTWSLVCIGLWLPYGLFKRFEAILQITSLTFILVWVPLPVCQTFTGNWSLCFPSIISKLASVINS